MSLNKAFWLPESFYASINEKFSGYKSPFVNLQHAQTDSNGYYVLKTGFKTLIEN